MKYISSDYCLVKGKSIVHLEEGFQKGTMQESAKADFVVRKEGGFSKGTMPVFSQIS